MGSNNPTLYKHLAEINSKPSTILSANAVEWAILRVFSSFCCFERLRLNNNIIALDFRPTIFLFGCFQRFTFTQSTPSKHAG